MIFCCLTLSFINNGNIEELIGVWKSNKVDSKNFKFMLIEKISRNELLINFTGKYDPETNKGNLWDDNYEYWEFLEFEKTYQFIRKNRLSNNDTLELILESNKLIVIENKIKTTYDKIE